MLSRRESRPRRPVKVQAKAKPKAGAKTARTGGSVENDAAALRKQLAAAEARIAVLERQRDEALNRIAWVIDSINSLAETIK